MAKFEKYAPLLSEIEGGFVDDPIDMGGATNRGVTLKTYIDYCSKKGLPKPTVEDLKNIPDEHWNDIMKSMYWDRWKADRIQNQSLAEFLVDWVVHSGSHGIKIPQGILGVTQDGIVGERTLAALANMYASDMFYQVKSARLNFFQNIVRRNPSQTRFLNGWKNRLEKFKFSY